MDNGLRPDGPQRLLFPGQLPSGSVSLSINKQAINVFILGTDYLTSASKIRDIQNDLPETD